jgi:CheY-like chemotaxis protein
MILIADDDIAVRASLLLLLENEGYKIATASSEDEALNIYVSMKFLSLYLI